MRAATALGQKQGAREPFDLSKDFQLVVRIHEPTEGWRFVIGGKQDANQTAIRNFRLFHAPQRKASR